MFKERIDSLGKKDLGSKIQDLAFKYKCTIVLKGPDTIVCSPGRCTIVKGGNAGLTKGGTGDVLAGLTVALYAKNDPHLAAAAASFLVKSSADELYEKVATNFNADDLANNIPKHYNKAMLSQGG